MKSAMERVGEEFECVIVGNRFIASRHLEEHPKDTGEEESDDNRRFSITLIHEKSKRRFVLEPTLPNAYYREDVLSNALGAELKTGIDAKLIHSKCKVDLKLNVIVVVQISFPTFNAKPWILEFKIQEEGDMTLLRRQVADLRNGMTLLTQYFLSRLWKSLNGGRIIDAGIATGKINDKSLSASSSWTGGNHSPKGSRLHSYICPSGHYKCWYPGTPYASQWIQVDLGCLELVHGISIQGRGDDVHWAKTFQVTHSIDGTSFVNLGKTFTGNVDQHTVVRHNFEVPFKARFVRCYPKSWNGAPAMRWELHINSPQSFDLFGEMRSELEGGGMKMKKLETLRFGDKKMKKLVKLLLADDEEDEEEDTTEKKKKKMETE